MCMFSHITVQAVLVATARHLQRPVLIFHTIDFTGRNGSSGTQGEKLFLVALLLSNMRVMEVLEIYIALLSVNAKYTKTVT